MPDTTGINGMRENFRVVGRRNLPWILSYALASGIAKFGIDYTAPDMLFAKFLRSTYAHARVKSIDTSKALAIQGVVGIVLWNDPDIMNLGKSPFGTQKPTYLLQEAHQEMQEVGAVVVAESEELCDEALRALIVQWEELPFIVDLHKGLDPGIPPIRGPEYDESHQYLPGAAMMFSPHYPTDPPRQGNVSYSNNIEGNIEEGYAKADFIIEYDTNLPAYASHIPTPPASIA
jgi:CO/xanthine dehydrogenase Mo-binding subunit